MLGQVYGADITIIEKNIIVANCTDGMIQPEANTYILY